MSRFHFENCTDARAGLKSLLDAEAGAPASVRRNMSRAAAVDAVRLRHSSRSRPRGAGWSVILPDLPVAAEGATFDEAVDEVVDALKSYASDWEDHCG
jgi:hypothetical protein